MPAQPEQSAGEIRSVALQQIAALNHTWRITRGDAGPELCASVLEWGCLVPPVLLPDGDTFVPVAGFKRLQALAAAQGPDEPVEVRVLPAATGALRTLQIAAIDVVRDRPATPFEIERALRIGLNADLTRATLAQHLLPTLGVEPHETVAKRHLKLGQVPAELAELLEEKHINLRRCLEFARVPSSGAQVLVELARTLNLSARALEEYGRMLGDVALRDDVTWRDAAEAAGIVALACDLELPINERNRRCGRLLRGARYPMWAAALETARVRVAAIDLPERVKLAWDDRFEQDGLVLEVAVTHAEGFERDMRQLLNDSQMKRLQDLLDAL